MFQTGRYVIQMTTFWLFVSMFTNDVNKLNIQLILNQAFQFRLVLFKKLVPSIQKLPLDDLEVLWSNMFKKRVYQTKSVESNKMNEVISALSLRSGKLPVWGAATAWTFVPLALSTASWSPDNDVLLSSLYNWPEITLALIQQQWTM